MLSVGLTVNPPHAADAMLPPTLAHLERSETVSGKGLDQQQLVADLLPWSDAAFLEDLLRLRKETDAALQSPGFGRTQATRIDYPKGACKPIRDHALTRLLTWPKSDASRPAWQAFSRFRSLGGVIKGIWGIQKGVYFQNAIQAGDLWVDLANDTVDLSRPPVEVCRLADAQFEAVESFERFAEVARTYWDIESYPNHVLPAVAAVLPLLLVSSRGLVRLATPTTLLPRNVRLDFSLAETFLERGPWAARKLPDLVLDRLEKAFRTHSSRFASAAPWGSPLLKSTHAEEASAAIAAERTCRRRLDDSAYTRRFLGIVGVASRPLLQASGEPAS